MGSTLNVHFSSKTDLWSTPKWLFDKLNAQYCFNLDVCATPENALCAKYFTKDQDGLKQEWTGSVWMNPPYGRGIGAWVKKAYDSAMSDRCVCVCLLPARTDTKWFHDYCTKGRIEFIKGRLKFGNAKNSAPFPSMIVVF